MRKLSAALAAVAAAVCVTIGTTLYFSETITAQQTRSVTDPKAEGLRRTVAVTFVLLLVATAMTIGPAPAVRAVTVGTTMFTDITPDNEATGSTLCQPTDSCTAQQNGGRVNGMAVVPDAPTVYFAASETGGLFKSPNGGGSWVHVDGYVPAVSWDVAVEPGGQRVFATSFNEGRNDTQSVLQVSTDGGATWNGRLPAPPSGCAAARASQPSAFGIALRPGTSDVYVGTNCGIASSQDAGDHWTRFDPTPNDAPSHIWDLIALSGGRTYACGDDGLLTSADGQPNSQWDALGTPPLFPGGYCSLAVSPDDPSVVFVAFASATFTGDLIAVGCCNFPPSGGGAEFYEGRVDFSTSSPTVAWTRLPYPDDIGDPTPTTITKKGRVPIVVTNDRSQGFDLWMGDGSLWRVPCSSQQSPSCPTDTSKWFGSFTDHLGTPNDAHGDSGDLEFDPSTGCPTLYSSDGGIYVNAEAQNPSTCLDDDHPPVFVGANVGLHAFLLWDMEGVAAQGAAAEDIYFATQDNGLFYTSDGGTSQPSSPSWVHPLGGDVFDVAADDTGVVVAPGGYLVAGDRGFQNTTTVVPSGLATLVIPDLIASVGSGEFMMVVPTATTWMGATIGIGVRDITDVKNAPFGVELTSSAGTPTPWSSTRLPCHIAVAVGPNGAQPYVLAGSCLWSSSNGVGGAAAATDELWTYREVAPGTKDWTQIAVPTGTGFGLIAVDPVNPDRLYASVLGTPSPLMMRSNDGGVTWLLDQALTDLMTAHGTFVPYPGVVADRIFTGLAPRFVAFDREAPNILVAGGNYSGVFLSTNGGESWALLTDPHTPGASGIPHLPSPAFAHFDHNDPGVVRLYLGTGRGIWRVDLANADLAVTKVDAPDPTVVGGNLTYTIEVSNAGPDMAQNATLEDKIPAGTTFQSLTAPAGWSCAHPEINGTGSVVCTTASMAPGTATFNLVVRVIAPVAVGTGVINTARTYSAAIDPASSNNVATATTAVLVPVAINIKPGSFPNAMNTKGAAPVAILTTSADEYGLPAAFDATRIDPLTVRFGPASTVLAGGGATEVHQKDHVEDAYELDDRTMDGDLDMVLHFRVASTGLSSASTEACVTGTFASGGATYSFFGCDSVKVVR